MVAPPSCAWFDRAVDELAATQLGRHGALRYRAAAEQEIAALFLSTKTIETHVSNILRKLGVGFRVEVARTIERAGHEDDRR